MPAKPTLPPGARLAFCRPCNTRDRVILANGRCLACGEPAATEVRDYTVARTVTVHAASCPKDAAVQYFEVTGETPGTYGTTVQVDGQYVVVQPDDVTELATTDEVVSATWLGPQMDAQGYAERYVR